MFLFYFGHQNNLRSFASTENINFFLINSSIAFLYWDASEYRYTFLTSNFEHKLTKLKIRKNINSEYKIINFNLSHIHKNKEYQKLNRQNFFQFFLLTLEKDYDLLNQEQNLFQEYKIDFH